MASATDTARAEPDDPSDDDRPRPPRRFGGSRLGGFILALNLLSLLILFVGALLLNEWRRGLIEARQETLAAQAELLVQVLGDERLGVTRGEDSGRMPRHVHTRQLDAILERAAAGQPGLGDAHGGQRASAPSEDRFRHGPEPALREPSDQPGSEVGGQDNEPGEAVPTDRDQELAAGHGDGLVEAGEVVQHPRGHDQPAAGGDLHRDGLQVATAHWQLPDGDVGQFTPAGAA